jgi:hypothetical protein
MSLETSQPGPEAGQDEAARRETAKREFEEFAAAHLDAEQPAGSVPTERPSAEEMRARASRIGRAGDTVRATYEAVPGKPQATERAPENVDNTRLSPDERVAQGFAPMLKPDDLPEGRPVFPPRTPGQMSPDDVMRNEPYEARHAAPGLVGRARRWLSKAMNRGRHAE